MLAIIRRRVHGGHITAPVCLAYGIWKPDSDELAALLSSVFFIATGVFWLARLGFDMLFWRVLTQYEDGSIKLRTFRQLRVISFDASRMKLVLPPGRHSGQFHIVTPEFSWKINKGFLNRADFARFIELNESCVVR